MVDRFRGAAADNLDYIRSNPEKAKEIEQKYLKTVSPRLPTYQFDLSAADLDASLRFPRARPHQRSGGRLQAHRMIEGRSRHPEKRIMQKFAYAVLSA